LYIRSATAGADGRGIPIYVEPVGLAGAEKTITSSVVQIDLEGLPLKVTLPIVLKQLGLTYVVRDGLLVITSEDPEAGWPTIGEDPYFLIGHCVFACLAAGLGSMLAPLVAGDRRRQQAPEARSA
jgi:hypothetical protein